MREDFIHYLWKFKKLSGLQLKTTKGKLILIENLGVHNHHSGPDFFNARVKIDDQLWAGNVEMHLRASDWFKHAHDDDPAYDNVILHVVWKHDAEISRRNDVDIPVLEVEPYINDAQIISYTRLFAYKNNQFINCEKSIAVVDRFKVDLWLEKVYLQRLEQRYIKIQESLQLNRNDWEATFFQLLARSFGTKVNADALEQMAQSLNPSVVRKLAANSLQLESVLMGQAGLLETENECDYHHELVKEYSYLKSKFKLKPIHTDLRFFRLRPANYPTVRISQLAMLYHKTPLLFAQVIMSDSREELTALFDGAAASYWDTHHIFGKETSFRKKKLSQLFIDLLIINCIAPVKFAFSKYNGTDNVDDVLQLIRSLPLEKNTITNGFKKLISMDNALHSQAVLQLKPNYCNVNQCLKCDIGIELLKD